MQLNKKAQLMTLVTALLLLLSMLGEAQTPSSQLQNDIQDLKKQVLKLNRNLFILEEDLLFPSNTQVSVFVSMDAANLFNLDSIQLKIDGKIVANHLYTQREFEALKRGGVQRLYLANLSSGEHELLATFVGKGPSPANRDYRRAQSIKFEKDSDAQFIELKIIDNPQKQQPEFNIKVWQ